MSEWIRCVDRMPDDDENVIVATYGGSVFPAYWDGENWLSPEECRLIGASIKYWMLMPEPPDE